MRGLERLARLRCSPQFPLAGAALAAILGLLALWLTPPPGQTAAAGFAGLLRLGLYALGGAILAATVATPVTSACGASDVGALGDTPRARRGYALLALGVLGSVGITLVNAVRLLRDIADPLGPALWFVAMLVLLGYALLPPARALGWRARWPRPTWSGPRRTAALATAAGLLLFAAVLRLPALDQIPVGINADEGDRAASALDVLNHTAVPSWFESGWFYINMVYFRLLAATMAIFGTDVAGGRMLNAIAGLLFVAALGWFATRAFGWRVGRVAMALAATLGMSIEHSRFIAETTPTLLLWTVSIGAFLEGARRGRAWAFVLAGITGALGLYFYPSARLWAVGAALTVLILFVFTRREVWPRLMANCALAAVAALVTATPFLIHLNGHRDEIAQRFQQTSVLDPSNQVRLPYLTAPEPVPRLLALQVERTFGMFDRYPDGGGFYPTGQPALPPFLAMLTLLGIVYVACRAVRDVRLAVLGVWFGVGISGVLLTVETPDFLRAVGMLPSLVCIMALTIVELVGRVVLTVPAWRSRSMLAAGLAAVVVVAVAQSELRTYAATFSHLPANWAPNTHEGQMVASLGQIGPVYSMEIDEHLVTSGWVRFLAPGVERGRVPNPGRELPALASPLQADNPNDRRPEMVAGEGQGLSVLLSGNPNQPAYLPLLHQLYPGGTVTDEPEQHQAFTVSAAGLQATRGAMLLAASIQPHPVSTFGSLDASVTLPASLTWQGGVLLPRSGVYAFAVAAPPGWRLAVDGMPLAGADASAPIRVLAARGLHFVQLTADVPPAAPPVSLALSLDGGPAYALAADAIYSLMPAPWGLLGQLAKPGQTAGLAAPADGFLDSTIGMTFFDPELGQVAVPNSIVWSGTLLAPRTGLYRFAFSAEDQMRLEVDGVPVEAPTVTPDRFATLGPSTGVPLTAGPHPVRVTLDVTHGGREAARWNWVLPQSNGAVDLATAWSVVPPDALRPAPAVKPA